MIWLMIEGIDHCGDQGVNLKNWSKLLATYSELDPYTFNELFKDSLSCRATARVQPRPTNLSICFKTYRDTLALELGFSYCVTFATKAILLPGVFTP